MPDIKKTAFASVILDTAIDKPLDYQVPSDFLEKITRGARVLVPVKNRLCKGTVFSLKQTPDFTPVQLIAELLTEKPLVSEELFQLAEWVSSYYCTPFRKVLKSILPATIRNKEQPKLQLFIKPNVSLNEMADLCETLRLTHPPQAQILDILLKFPKGILQSELIEKSKISKSPIDTLIKKKILISQKIAIDRSNLVNQEYFPTKPKLLNEEQSQALNKIKNSLSASLFQTHLLFGVTGSGKTEIYLQAIEHALSLGKGAILLVPEIALTSQTIERLRSRFSEKIAILHHRLSHGERYDSWHHIHEGRCQIVVGARSAIFSPIKNLGLILVDEEHESSYKQTDESPCYHARDVAVMRGKFSSATVVLGSATPSLESYYNAMQNKYSLSLLTLRPNDAKIPSVSLIDMRQEYAKSKGATLFSDPLLKEIEARITIGEQVLLFLNRRGYHTSQLCLKCGHVIECPHCDVSLTYHLGENILACHLCDHRLSPPPRSCPKCHSADSLKFKGVGTELVERSLHAIFPQVRTLRLDADTTRHKGSHEQLFKQFRSGKADVLIGTQMIAKGLHFPQVTLVGVLNADMSLNIPDFRASEHVFQLITQVAGRSGRGTLPGKVLIQTFLPDHEIILSAADQNFTAFYEKEIQVRQFFHFPPFTHLLKLSFKGPSEQKIQAFAQSIRQQLIQKLPSTYEFLPAVPSGHAKVKDHFCYQFLIKAEKLAGAKKVLIEMQKNLILPKDTRFFIDVDPISTFF